MRSFTNLKIVIVLTVLLLNAGYVSAEKVVIEMEVASSVPVGSRFEINLGVVEAGISVKVDFGNGELVQKRFEEPWEWDFIEGMLGKSRIIRVYGETDDISGLMCRKSQIVRIDVSSNISLRELDVENNQLKELDVSHNNHLRHLNCCSNVLTDLDLSNNAQLSRLYCFSNQLNHLDLSYNPLLEELDCTGNQLDEVDLSNNVQLMCLECGGNQLKDLDLSYNLLLTKLICYDNELLELDAEVNENLSILDCAYNKMTSLLLPLKKFDEIDFDYNYLTEDAVTPGFEEYYQVDRQRDPATLPTASPEEVKMEPKVYGYRGSIYAELMNNGSAHLNIYNQTGILVAQRQLSGGGQVIPVQQSGIFIVEIQSGDFRFLKKVLVR